MTPARHGRPQPRRGAARLLARGARGGAGAAGRARAARRSGRRAAGRQPPGRRPARARHAAARVAALVPPALLPRRLRPALDPWRADGPRRVGWPVGACIAARTETLRRLGPFDPDIFLYAEDLDLGLRAADAGIETWFWPHARVLHRRAHATSRAFDGEPFELLAQPAARGVTGAARPAAQPHRRRHPGRHVRQPDRAEDARAPRHHARAAPARGAPRREAIGLSAPVVINGRAAVRREVGGVERVAREMAALLPRLDPAPLPRRRAAAGARAPRRTPVGAARPAVAARADRVLPGDARPAAALEAQRDVHLRRRLGAPPGVVQRQLRRLPARACSRGSRGARSSSSPRRSSRARR